ncbi:hypothetical protein RhiirA4_546117 [Rhizophagus irregularis]|uniref:Uncharacterized protein n=1 Tax=Rhizophagus irregularis TaxID=588596 RepID=A0A2I1GVQ4_9GLOM|nr:hypothetical protein RhiirA4_546117 [Rhizophagus irregularis]
MPQYTIFVIEHGDQPAFNWPSCCPIIYHDIEAEFTDERAKKFLRRSYFLCKLYIAMLVVHSCADISIAVLASNVANILAELLGSLFYLTLLPFGDFFGRHLSLYVAFKHNSESSFRYYFIGEAIIIIFGLGIAFVQTILHIILTIQVYRNFKSRNFTLFPRRNTGAPNTANTANVFTTTRGRRIN